MPDRVSLRPLIFSPRAWLKLQFLCHAGPTEVAGFGLSDPDDPLYLDDVLLVRQRCTFATVALDDGAVADLFDRMADAGFEVEESRPLWGARRAFAIAPAGHRVELMEAPPPASV